MKRGKYEMRFDVQFYLPIHRELQRRMHSCGYPVYPIGSKEISKQVVDGPFGSDLKVDDYVPEGVPLIRVSNCRTGLIQIDDELVFITEEKHKQIVRSEVLPGDVLLTKAGAILGYSAVFPQELQKGNITSHLVSIRPTEKVESRYLSEFLTSKLGIQQIYRWGNKSTRPELNTDEVRAIEVILPSLTKQKELVAAMEIARAKRTGKLQQGDALLTGMNEYVCSALGIRVPKIKARLAVAVTARQLKADNAFNVNYYNPERLETIKTILKSEYKRLGDCVDFHRDIVTAVDDRYLGLAGVQSNTGELSGADEEATGQAFLFHANDVLFCRLRPYLNKVWKAECSGVCSTEFQILRMKSNDILPDYLSAVMRSTLVLNQTRHMMTGNTHPRISPEDVANLLIPIPSISIQQKITNEMQLRQTTARVLRSEAENEWAAAKAQFEQELLNS